MTDEVFKNFLNSVDSKVLPALQWWHFRISSFKKVLFSLWFKTVLLFDMPYLFYKRIKKKQQQQQPESTFFVQGQSAASVEIPM